MVIVSSIPVSPYLMHLIELPEKPKKSSAALLEQQYDESSVDEEYNYNKNDVLEINEAVDIFIEETKTMIHQVQTVGSSAIPPFKH